MSKRVSLFLLPAACAGIARADQVAVIPASGDATLFGASASNNSSSSGPGMFVGTDGTSTPKRGLIEFNIDAAVPAGATITSASLTLYLGMVAGAGGSAISGTTTARTINLFAVSPSDAWHSGGNVAVGTGPSGFGGKGMGSSPVTGDPTWNYTMYNTASWTTPGGDFSSTASSTLTDTTTWSLGEAYTWPSTSLMVTNVQGWLDGTTTNNGWLLQNTSESAATTFRAFYTAEGAADVAGASGYAPELTVDYIAAPEPGAAFIFVAAPLLLLRRKHLRSQG